MYAQSSLLIFVLMDKMTVEFWDNESFHSIYVGHGFNEVQLMLRLLDEGEVL